MPYAGPRIPGVDEEDPYNQGDQLPAEPPPPPEPPEPSAPSPTFTATDPQMAKAYSRLSAAARFASGNEEEKGGSQDFAERNPAGPATFQRYDTQGQQRIAAQQKADEEAASEAARAETTNPLALPLGAIGKAEEKTRIPYVSDAIASAKPTLTKAADTVAPFIPGVSGYEAARELSKRAGGPDLPSTGEIGAGLIPESGLDLALTAAPFAKEVGPLAREAAANIGRETVSRLGSTAAEEIGPQVYRIAVKPGAVELVPEEYAMERAAGSQIVTDPAGVRILKPGETAGPGETELFHGTVANGIQGEPRAGMFLTPERDAAQSYANTAVKFAQMEARQQGPMTSLRRAFAGERGSVRVPGEEPRDIGEGPQAPPPLPGQKGMFGEEVSGEGKIVTPPPEMGGMQGEGFRGEQSGLQPPMFGREETGQTGQMGLEEGLKPASQVRGPDFLKTAPPVVEAPATAMHGTGSAFEAFGEDRMDQTALFGPGVYLTDNEGVAGGYAKARARKTGEAPVTHDVRIKPGTRLLNLEQPLPRDAAAAVAKQAQDAAAQGWYDADSWDMAAKAIAEGKPGKAIYSAFKDGMADGMTSVSDAGEALDALNQTLRQAGYDGLAHTGGIRGGASHNVSILFDPASVEGMAPRSAAAEATTAPAIETNRKVVPASDLTYRPDLFQTRDTSPGQPFSEARVKQLTENWDPAQFTPPTVVADPENPGKYITTAGQHRTEAFRRVMGPDANIEVNVSPHDISDPAQLARARLEANASNATTKPLNVREEVRNLQMAHEAGLSPEETAANLGKPDAYVAKLSDVASVGAQAVDRVTQEPALFDLAAEVGRGQRAYGLSEEDANGLFNRWAEAPKGQRPTVTAARETIDKYGKALAEVPQGGLFDTGQFEGMGRGGILGIIDENARIRTELQTQIRRMTTAQNQARRLAGLPGAGEEDVAAAERLVQLGKAQESRLREELAANEEDVARALRGEAPQTRLTNEAETASTVNTPPVSNVGGNPEPPRRDLELSGQEPPVPPQKPPTGNGGGFFPGGEAGGGKARLRPARTLSELFGIETPTPELSRWQEGLNALKSVTGGTPDEPIAAGAFKTLREGKQQVEAQANRLGAVSSQLVKEGGFNLDEAGRIVDLPGQPTIQDVAAKLPQYEEQLTVKQQLALEELRAEVRPYAQALKEQGVDFGSRADVEPGGFYLPRGRADLEGADEAISGGGGRRLGAKRGFERSATFDSMAQGIEAGYKYAPLEEAIQSYAKDAGNRALDAYTADYLKGAGGAEPIPTTGNQGVPRGRRTINDFNGLQGVSFPEDVANAANKYIDQLKPPSGAGAPLVKAIGATNNFLRGIRATADVSFMGIQGLLGAAHDPQAYGKGLQIAFRSFVDKDALGSFLRDFDKKAIVDGLPTSREWVAAGLRIGGRDTEYEIGKGLGSVGQRIGNAPVITQANRSFGFFGDTVRQQMAQDIFENNVAARGLEGEARTKAMKEIAEGSNLMTGWSRGRFGGDFGNLFQFAPRFFQSQLELVGKALTNGGMTGDQARKALVKMVGYGTLITAGANTALGNDPTDFDYLKPFDQGGLNSNFMRIRVKGNDVSVFGPWDSLARGVAAAGGGDFGYLGRTKASPVVQTAIDLIGGTDFQGQDVGGQKVAGIHTGNADYWLHNLLPFSLSGIDKQNAAGTVIGVTGLKSSPLSPSEVRDVTAEDQYGGRTFNRLLPSEQAAVKEGLHQPESPEVKKLHAGTEKIAQAQQTAEDKFKAGTLPQKLGDEYHDLGLQRRQLSGDFENFYSEQVSGYPKTELRKITDGYYNVQKNDVNGNFDYDATKAARDEYVAGLSDKGESGKPSAQAVMKDYLSWVEGRKTPLQQKRDSFIEDKKGAGYFADGAKPAALDKAHPDLDVKGWYFGGGTADTSKSPALQTAGAVDQALQIVKDEGLKNRPVKLEGLGRPVNESPKSEQAWTDSKKMLDRYDQAVTKLEDRERERRATENAAYDKPFDQLTPEEKGSIHSSLRTQIRTGTPELDAWLVWWGASQSLHSEAAVTELKTLTEKYGKNIPNVKDLKLVQ